MVIKITTDEHRRCNFCDNDVNGKVIYTFIRDAGNSLMAYMCEDCLKELMLYHLKRKL